MSANEEQIGGDHYKYKLKGFPGMECWDWAYLREYDNFQTAIFKYLDRHKNKNGVEDLKKARHYLDKYIEVLEEKETVPEEDPDYNRFGYVTNVDRCTKPHHQWVHHGTVLRNSVMWDQAACRHCYAAGERRTERPQKGQG